MNRAPSQQEIFKRILKKAFDLYDSDGSGDLSPDELEKL